MAVGPHQVGGGNKVLGCLRDDEDEVGLVASGRSRIMVDDPGACQVPAAEAVPQLVGS